MDMHVGMSCGNDMYECCITTVEPGNDEIITTSVCKQLDQTRHVF